VPGLVVGGQRDEDAGLGGGRAGRVNPRVRGGHAAIPACVPVGCSAIFLEDRSLRVRFQSVVPGISPKDPPMASVVDISCPNCDKILRVPPAVFGKRVKCKHCEHAFVVEAPDAAKPAKPAKPGAKPAAKAASPPPPPPPAKA